MPKISDMLLEQLKELVDYSGENEASKIVPNATVINGTPADLSSSYIIVEDETGHYIPAVKVPGVTFSAGDKVNLLLLKGTEPIAFQHGTGSSSTGGTGISAVDAILTDENGDVLSDANGDVLYDESAF